MAQAAVGRLVETGTDWGDTRSARIPKSASAGGACLPASVGPLFLQSKVATKLRLARLAAAALASGAAAAGAAGCGGSHPRPAALRLERADLVLLAHTLQRLQAPTSGEDTATRAVWPALAGGLPRSLSPALLPPLSVAERRATAITLPAVVTTEGALTGPAAGLAGLLKAYTRLTQRGWQFTAAALATESAGSALPGGGMATTQAARFLRSNSALYIYCIYDGHYDLSLIAKALPNAYHTLGGAPAFGGSLTQAQVDALARVYSHTRLAPHPPPGLVV